MDIEKNIEKSIKKLEFINQWILIVILRVHSF